MPEFFDYRPDRGITETWDYDEMTGKAYIRHEQDLTGFFARQQEIRNTGAAEKGLMENGMEFHLHASIPPVVQIELRNKGIDIYSSDPAMIRRMHAEINQNYPHCLCNSKKIWK